LVFFEVIVETKVFSPAMASSLKVLMVSASSQTLAITADALDGEWWKDTKIVPFVHQAMTS